MPSRLRRATCLLLFVAGALAAQRPNIVFIFSDDHACHAISAYGSRINETPNIDRLAREGCLFRQSFCGNSICAPSRATVLTGKHSHQNGIRTNGDRFDGEQVTFPRLLQAAGYQTALIGKWHLKSDPTGFDHWDVLPGQGRYYNPDFRTAAGKRRIEGYCTEIITELSLDWLEKRDPEKPFLLMCQHKAPHRNWMPAPSKLELYADRDLPEPPTLFDDWSGRAKALPANEMSLASFFYWEYDLKLPGSGLPEPFGKAMKNWEYKRMTEAQRQRWDAVYGPRNAAFLAKPPQGRALLRWKYQRYVKDYLRCIASVDDSVGALLSWLETKGLAENTIVVYASDQGFYLGDHGWYDKRWMFEESLRMPLLVRWPRRIPAGREVQALVQNIDYAPTFLAAAGAEVPEEMQGESLLPLCTDATSHGPWRDAIWYAYYEKGIHNVAPHEGVRTTRHKLMWFPESKELQLFDLELDPHELKSVHASPVYAAIREDLLTKLRHLRKRYAADPWPLP